MKTTNYEISKKLAEIGFKDSYIFSWYIDEDGNYEPNNCRWATNKEQFRNKSTTKYITYQNRTMALLDWCDELNLSYQLMRGRLLTGWTAERAFTTPKVPPSFASQKKLN